MLETPPGLRPLAVTMGDPAGIGPEIIAKAFRDAPDVMRGCFVAGDVATLRRAAAWVTGEGVALPVAVIEQPADALRAPPRCVPVLQVVEPAAQPVPLGQVARALQEDPATCRIPGLRRLWADHQAALAADHHGSEGATTP